MIIVTIHKRAKIIPKSTKGLLLKENIIYNINIVSKKRHNQITENRFPFVYSSTDKYLFSCFIILNVIIKNQ